MRILSQDGMADYPYDEIGVSIGWRGDEKEYYIFWNSIQRQLGAKIATYSSIEKAKRAMEMLRKAFDNYDWLKTTGNSDEIKEVARFVDNEQFKKLTASYFQFPADDELEG